jgi:hypothetical protein
MVNVAEYEKRLNNRALFQGLGMGLGLFWQ